MVLNKMISNKQVNRNNFTPSPPPSYYGSKKDVSCQTLSTGDIVITKIHFQEDQDKQSKILISSPKV